MWRCLCAEILRPQFSRWTKAKQSNVGQRSPSRDSLGALSTGRLPARLILSAYPPGPHQTKHKIEEGSWPTSLRSELWTGVDAQWGRAGGLGRCTVVSSGGLLTPSRPFPQSHTRQCQTHEAFRILSNPRFFPPANIGSGRSDMGFPPNWGGWHSCVVGWQSSYHWRRWQACCQCCNAGNRLRNEKANRAGWDASLDRDGRTDMDDKGELDDIRWHDKPGRQRQKSRDWQGL